MSMLTWLVLAFVGSSFYVIFVEARCIRLDFDVSFAKELSLNLHTIDGITSH
jgi:hypothetical protein